MLGRAQNLNMPLDIRFFLSLKVVDTASALCLLIFYYPFSSRYRPIALRHTIKPHTAKINIFLLLQRFF